MTTTGTYTIAEVQAILACSRSTVVRMLADKQLTRVKVRRGVRIPAAEVDALAAGRSTRRKSA